MDFITTITDPDELAGITAAREAYNAARPEDVEGETPAPGPFETDQDYWAFVTSTIAPSYVRQYGRKRVPTADADLIGREFTDAEGAACVFVAVE